MIKYPSSDLKSPQGTQSLTITHTYTGLDSSSNYNSPHAYFDENNRKVVIIAVAPPLTMKMTEGPQPISKRARSHHTRRFSTALSGRRIRIRKLLSKLLKMYLRRLKHSRIKHSLRIRHYSLFRVINSLDRRSFRLLNH